MGWLDSIAASAGLKMLQSGADLRIMQLGMFDLGAIPGSLKARADALVAQQLNDGVLKPEDDYSAAALKLALFHAIAEDEGAVELQLVMRAAINQINQRAGDAIGPEVTFQVMDLTRERPRVAVPPPLPSPAVPAISPTQPVDFAEEHELLWGDYDEGAISDEECDRRFRQLLLDEVTRLVDTRLTWRANRAI